MSEYLCGYCGVQGRGQTNGHSAPWCANCQKNDKLILITENTEPDKPDGSVGDEEKQDKMLEIMFNMTNPEPLYTLDQAMPLCVERIDLCDQLTICRWNIALGKFQPIPPTNILALLNSKESK